MHSIRKQIEYTKIGGYMRERRQTETGTAELDNMWRDNRRDA